MKSCILTAILLATTAV
jgi:hypothetical protein